MAGSPNGRFAEQLVGLWRFLGDTVPADGGTSDGGDGGAEDSGNGGGADGGGVEDGGIALWEPTYACLTIESGCTPSLHAMQFYGPTSAWAVGTFGTALRFAPSTNPDAGFAASWEFESGRTTRTLNGVWGTSAEDAWAVGEEGIIRHYTGGNWVVVESPTPQALNGVWGANASDIWAVGKGATALHYDGTWQPARVPVPADVNLYGVWGSGMSVWAVGDGVVLRRTQENRRLP